MARSNREAALAFHDAYNATDIERVYELLHPDVEIRGHDGRISHGPEEAVASMLGWRKEWQRFDARLEEFVDLGDDRALLTVRSRGIGRNSGIEIEMLGSEIWTFSDGRVASSSCIERGRRRSQPPAARDRSASPKFGATRATLPARLADELAARAIAMDDGPSLSATAGV